VTVTTVVGYGSEFRRQTRHFGLTYHPKMAYSPDRDLYALLGVPAAAGSDQIRSALQSLRGEKDDMDLEEAARVLLNLDLRTRYDAERATCRVRTIMRDSLAMFSGRTPGRGVPLGWPPGDS
jgi:hypothetical protein